MNPSATDWLAVFERMRAGDRRAFLELSRLLTYLLSGMRAYDYRSEWDDVIQDVILSTDRAIVEGRIDDASKVLAYVRATTRNRFIDGIRRRRRRGEQADDEADGVEGVAADPGGVSLESEISVRDAVERIPEKERACVLAVYVEGLTYDEASASLDIPLGSLKRFLRQGLAGLRRQMGAESAGGEAR